MKIVSVFFPALVSVTVILSLITLAYYFYKGFVLARREFRALAESLGAQTFGGLKARGIFGNVPYEIFIECSGIEDYLNKWLKIKIPDRFPGTFTIAFPQGAGLGTIFESLKGIKKAQVGDGQLDRDFCFRTTNPDAVRSLFHKEAAKEAVRGLFQHSYQIYHDGRFLNVYCAPPPEKSSVVTNVLRMAKNLLNDESAAKK